MKKVQSATKEQQPLTSLMGNMTYLYMQDISKVISDPEDLIKKEALFNVLVYMPLYFRDFKVKGVRMSV